LLTGDVGQLNGDYASTAGPPALVHKLPVKGPEENVQSELSYLIIRFSCSHSLFWQDINDVIRPEVDKLGLALEARSVYRISERQSEICMLMSP
jgi:hypothetical protein